MRLSSRQKVRIALLLSGFVLAAQLLLVFHQATHLQETGNSQCAICALADGAVAAMESKATEQSSYVAICIETGHTDPLESRWSSAHLVRAPPGIS